MMNIIKTKTTFYAQAPLISRSVDTINVFYSSIFYFEIDLAPNTTKRADTLSLTIKVFAITNLIGISHSSRHQSTSWTGLHAFATCDTATITHWIRHIKSWIRVMASTRHTNYVIYLDLTTSPYAKPTLNAGI